VRRGSLSVVSRRSIVILSEAKNLLRFALVVSVAAGCGWNPKPPFIPQLSPSAFDFSVDTFRTEMIARGVQHTFAYAKVGPWAINVLDVRLDRCFKVEAAKGAHSAEGRNKTTEILRVVERDVDVLGGVNADFFSLQTGVPTNALVHNGRVITPPSAQPVFAIDSLGRPRIEVLTVRGGGTFALDDPALDRVSLEPFHPMEAVGGRPRLLSNGIIVMDVDTVGGAAFAVMRHPRTAIGIANNGRRLFIVVVDGRRPFYSNGMSLRELAELMRSLGAREALNLDGGGSTTMVVENVATRKLEVVNRPSDAAGERTVGDALAVVGSCKR
jgi:hypothetical protein